MQLRLKTLGPTKYYYGLVLAAPHSNTLASANHILKPCLYFLPAEPRTTPKEKPCSFTPTLCMPYWSTVRVMFIVRTD